MQDLYKTVADTIKDQMEQGRVAWEAPWQMGAAFEMPMNKTTGQPYHGMNIPLLWSYSMEHGYETNQWATMKQWNKKGEWVKKGSKRNLIVFYDTKEIEQDDGTKKRIPFLKESYVFNRSQLEGYKPEPQIILPEAERIEHAEHFLYMYGAKVYDDQHNKAYYDIKTDEIHLPTFGKFKTKEGYYATSFHEHIHQTGTKERMDRQFGKRFGDKAYAWEEMVAEMGAAFLCAELKIENTPKHEHADYLANWYDMIDKDPKAFVYAVNQAGKACEFMKETVKNYKEPPECLTV